MREQRKGSVSGLTDDVRTGFEENLRDLGYRPATIVSHLRLLADLDWWLREAGLQPSEFHGQSIERFLADRRSSRGNSIAARGAAPLLAFLRSGGLIPVVQRPVPQLGSADALLEEWVGYLLRERRLTAGTVRNYRRWARPWMVSRTMSDVVDLAGLTAADICGYLSQRLPVLSAGSAKATVTALRSLLRFLHASGRIEVRLDAVVPAVAGCRDRGLPRWLTADQVNVLVAACDQSSVMGCRDRTIIILMARLGLRAGEIAAICLEDLNWKTGTLLVHGKGGYIDELPLPIDAGEALAAYLSVRVAVASERYVFQRNCAPHGGMTPEHVSKIVVLAGQRAGLGRVTSHQLRHTVATATVNAGASLEETAQLLRHRSLGSTTIYAKVDLVRLSSIARPWPGTLPDALTTLIVQAGASGERA